MHKCLYSVYSYAELNLICFMIFCKKSIFRAFSAKTQYFGDCQQKNYVVIFQEGGSSPLSCLEELQKGSDLIYTSGSENIPLSSYNNSCILIFQSIFHNMLDLEISAQARILDKILYQQKLIQLKFLFCKN